MKLIRRRPPSGLEKRPVETPAELVEERQRFTWKLMVVDDDPDILQVTRFNLKGFEFAERPLEIIEAESAAEACKLLEEHDDIAVALIDVVMESDDAGLKLVEHIRQTLNNQMIRLVIRTGQPGLAPERYVIDHFDIDDYKDKTELTATRLYTSVRSALKAYRDLKSIDLNRLGLSCLLESMPDIYRLNHSTTSVSQFFEGVLTQIIGLCNLSESGVMSTIGGVIATLSGDELHIEAATGPLAETPDRLEQIQAECVRWLRENHLPGALRDDAYVMPLMLEGAPAGFIYVEPTRHLSTSDFDLLTIFARQCSSALDNLRLHNDLEESYRHIIDMLARVAEFKDRSTGEHINRIDRYTRLLAMELGTPAAEAELWGKASRLHDVGKVGIPDEVLRKPGRLDSEEYDVIRTHTRIGAAILGHDKSLGLAREIASHHHEHWEGGGYPTGRPASDFSLVTRIVSVVDVYDALVSERPYKSAWPEEKAVEEIRRGSGTQFDPTVVEAFLTLHGRGDLSV